MNTRSLQKLPAKREHPDAASQARSKPLPRSETSTRDDWGARAEEAARAFHLNIESYLAGRPGALAVAEIIGTHGDFWFGRAVEAYDKLSPLQPGSDEYETHKARDVAISVGIWWKHLSPYRITMVDAEIHTYMLSGGAPLPSDPDSWKTQRKRILRGAYAALDPKSGMSDGWRKRWLARYPLTVSAIANVGFRPGRRTRMAYPRDGARSAP